MKDLFDVKSIIVESKSWRLHEKKALWVSLHVDQCGAGKSLEQTSLLQAKTVHALTFGIQAAIDDDRTLMRHQIDGIEPQC